MLAKMYERDLRTVYGNNLKKISNICDIDIDKLSPQIVKNHVRYRNLPENEAWRIPILTEMLFARENRLEIEGLSTNDINDIINYVCTV